MDLSCVGARDSPMYVVIVGLLVLLGVLAGGNAMTGNEVEDSVVGALLGTPLDTFL